MISINMVDVLIIICVIVDDWYQTIGQDLLTGKAGVKPVFSDSELLTLMETQDVAYIRANYQREFPPVVEQSQYHRRARGLWRVLEALRESWVRQLGAWADKQLLLDTKPVPVVGYMRSKRHSNEWHVYVTTPPAKAGGFLRSNPPQQRLLRLRMSQRSTLSPEGSVRAYWVTRSFRRFKSYMRDYPAQPLNLKLLKSVVTTPCRAKVERSVLQKGAKRNAAVA